MAAYLNHSLMRLWLSYISICLLTAVGLRPLCSKSGLVPLIESPSLPRFPFDFDQAQKPFSHSLTLLVLCQQLQTQTGICLIFTAAVWGQRGRAEQPVSPSLQRKSQSTDRNSHFLESSLSLLMARRTKREGPGPRYHPCSFGRTSEDRGKLFSFDWTERVLTDDTNVSSSSRRQHINRAPLVIFI